MSIVSFVLCLSLAAIYSFVSGMQESKNTLPFQSITNLSELDAALAQAKQTHQPVMLDVFANWCVACHELDEKTFSKSSVANMLNEYTRLRIDVSKNTDENQAFLEKLNIYGLPHVRFYQPDGAMNSDMIINGFIDEQGFNARFKHCQLQKAC